MSYAITHDNARLWVTFNDRLLGAYTANDLRSYVFPFYSPRGALVVQESPPDHPHHQGIWAGLELDGFDLWNAGSRKLPRHRQELIEPLGEISTACSADGARLDHEVRWSTVDSVEILHETRSVTFSAKDACNEIAWQSTFFHPAKSTAIGRTKESGLGLRVPPHWETPFGGVIRNAAGDTGEAGCFDKDADWLNIEGTVVDDIHAGIVLVPTSAACPWFARDYGVHVYNPARQRAIRLEPEERLTWSLRVLSYDGRKSISQVRELVAQQ